MPHLVFLAVMALAGAASPNLVGEPTFSRGVLTPEGWLLNEVAGNQCIWVCGRGHPERCGVQLVGSGQDWAGVTAPRVTVAPGETLTIAAWLGSAGIAAGQGHLFVEFWADQAFVAQTGPDAAPDCRAWTLCAGTVTVPAGASSACASFQLWSRGKVLLGAIGLFRGDVTAQVRDLLPKPAPMAKPVAVTSPRGLPADRNRNGIADTLEEFLGMPRGARSVRQTRRNTTCLQTPTGYIPDNDLKVDTILVVNSTRQALQSWQRMGYHSYFMVGFRDYQSYVDAHPGSVQQDRAGRLLDCGPGSYYMVPTEDRRRIFRERFREAFKNGAEAAAPEEPEYIGSGGYAPAFQREFEAHYGRPWVAPYLSPQARVDCQRLMGHLEVELLRACYEGARSVKPKAPCFLLAHSPVNYAAWNIAFPHCEALRSLPITEMIAQVWTGTARSPINYQGSRAERTFENAWLEYSSCANLVRGMKVPLWLLMDPVEDNPDRPMDDYFRNYARTLGAALMFPETDRYEVMPWPTRIFGRVPNDFATVICTIVNALADVQHHPAFRHDRGTEGIASFLSDTAYWQRDEPAPSDFDAVYGLTLPLLMRGIPAELAYLDRVTDPGYLKPYKVLLVSFDAMKPQRKEIVDALAAWAKAGGHLLVFGGEDAYNNLDLWWRKEGCASPHEYLLRALGLNTEGMRPLAQVAPDAPFQVVARTDYTGRALENQATLRLDLTAQAAATGGVFLKFEDAVKSDGWGPYITALRLIGTRDGEPLDEAVRLATPEEERLIYRDTGSGAAGEGRFVDADRFFVYLLRFDPGTKAEVEITIGNHYCVSAAPAPADAIAATSLRPAAGSVLGAALGPIAAPTAMPVLAYPRLGGETALTSDAGAVMAEVPVGKGSVLVCGLPPAWFAKSPEADAMLRALVRHVCEARAGLSYREQGHMGIERGPYVVVKTLDQPADVEGPMVDLMSPTLALRPAGPLQPDGLVILKRLPKPAGPAPALAAASGCVEWQATRGPELRLVISGPAGVKGVLRLVTGGRPLTVQARGARGGTMTVAVETQGETALLRLDLQPEGVGLRIRAG